MIDNLISALKKRALYSWNRMNPVLDRRPWVVFACMGVVAVVLFALGGLGWLAEQMGSQANESGVVIVNGIPLSNFILAFVGILLFSIMAGGIGYFLVLFIWFWFKKK